MDKNDNTIQNNSIVARPPVVVILGHVDSGKTSLLQAIRQMQFTDSKPGGVITQHIGAYQVEIGNSSANSGQRKITFIDTPGHEAFSAMRGRGAKVADIAILVVDGAEGVKPQTKEAISTINSAQIPMIVAINKVDKPGVLPEKVKTQLMKENVLVESLGGKIPSVNVSAKTGQGIPDLLETVLLLGEMENLKGDLQKPAEGVIIESFLDSRRGSLATLIVSDGCLKIGDAIGTPSAFGKVRSLENFRGELITSASPSDPAVIIGFSGVPRVGEQLKVFSDLNEAKGNMKTEERKAPSVLEIKEGQKILKVILKSDVKGSIEAIQEVLGKIPQEKVVLNILDAEVGDVSESDVKLARSAGAVIFGFRVKTNPVAKQMAEKEKIKILSFSIIYDLVEGVRNFMERILSPEDVRTELGKIKILAVFMAEKNRQIVGGRVISGEIKKSSLIEVVRNDEVVGKGKMVNLQRNKKDADRVSRGDECGVLFEGDVKIESGDILTVYTEIKVKGEL